MRVDEEKREWFKCKHFRWHIFKLFIELFKTLNLIFFLQKRELARYSECDLPMSNSTPAASSPPQIPPIIDQSLASHDGDDWDEENYFFQLLFSFHFIGNCSPQKLYYCN